MNIDDFLERFVEGYLFHDLESMEKITLPDGQDDGAVGYPMVATVLAGMELLGGLLMPNTEPFNPRKTNDYFLNYWDNYFAKQNQAYTGLGRLFRQLIRHGISHTFVAKPGIFVEKGSNRQMSIDTTRQEIYIDCNVFFKEFGESYRKLVRPIVDNTAVNPLTNKSNMQTRLDDLNRAYSNDSTRLFNNLPTLHPSTVNIGRRSQAPVSPFFPKTRSSGASPSFTPLHTSTPSKSNGFTSPSTTVPFEPTSGALPSDKK